MPAVVVAAILGGLVGAQTDAVRSVAVRPETSRFETVAPLPSLPSLLMDVKGNGVGLAQQTARSKNLQARILWIDATANLDRMSSDDRIERVVEKAKDLGFNAIIFDVKPIVGYTLYPSKLTDKLTEWRDQKLPIDYDPLAAMVRVCKAKGMPLYAGLNAFSEGHRLTRSGPGYANPDQQTVQYEAKPIIRGPWPTSANFPLTLGTDWEVPKNDAIEVFGSIPAGAKVPVDTFGVVIDADYQVRDRVGYTETRPLALPSGGSILIGKGAGAKFLKDWARTGTTVKFDSETSYVRIANRQTQWPLMMNPHHPEVQKRAMAFVEEVLRNYNIEGIVYDDRLRFGGLNADFSDLTKRAFETHIGQRIQWPDDVYKITYSAKLEQGLRPGRWFDAWLSWRAMTMRNWVADVRAMIDRVKPGAQFGVYAGSWFGEYQKFGNHYGSPDFEAGFPFLTREYRKTGYAPFLDFLITGCYYRTATIAEAMEKNVPPGYTVEAAGQLSNRVARDNTWVYAGIKLDDFYGNPRGLVRALQAAAGSTQGIMVFDLSHKFETFYSVFEQAFRQTTKAPNTVPGLLQDVRRRRLFVDAMGVKDPPVAIYEGAAGTGF